MLTALIVEDNQHFRQSLSQILKGRFPSMSIVEDSGGDDVLEKVRQLMPNLVVMDIKLPGKNGLTLTEEIKNSDRSIAVIIVSGLNLPEYREAARRSGADYFLSKDELNPDMITALIESLLRISGN